MGNWMKLTKSRVYNMCQGQNMVGGLWSSHYLVAVPQIYHGYHGAYETIEW